MDAKYEGRRGKKRKNSATSDVDDCALLFVFNVFFFLLSLSLSFAALLGGEEEEATTCYSTSAWVTFVPMCVCVQKEEGE